jgi:hypothetical protein
VVVDSCFWLAAVCLIAAIFPIYAAIVSGKITTFAGAFFCLLFSVVWLRKSTFVFDATQRVVRWKRLRYFATSGGTISFNDIRDIVIETTQNRSGTLYRLAITTLSASVPLADAYSGGSDKYARLREEILGFVKPQASMPGAGDAQDLKSSVRELLLQGRKIDAVALLRNAEDLDFTVATERVEEIEVGMKAGK